MADSQTGDSASDWTCSRCTFINRDTAVSQCGVCEAPRPLRETTTMHQTNSWVDVGPTVVALPPLAPQSGTQHSGHAVVAEAAQPPHNTATMASESSYSYSFWTCTRCTFNNNSVLPYCEICEAPRPEEQIPDKATATELLKKEVGEKGKILSSAIAGFGSSLKSLVDKAQSGALAAEIIERSEKSKKELSKSVFRSILDSRALETRGDILSPGR